ncbi:MAG: phosphoglycerate mutase [Caldiserica bacterium]|nr:MAG: phosphoglycerate mutase [Caldisericota bacterium]
MVPLKILKSIAQKNEKKILLIVLDGVGGIPFNYGKTELEMANTPNLDKFASISETGFHIPCSYGITPGSGPAHLGIFGYDPFSYTIGRGVLEALGIGVELEENELCARANFATIDKNGIVIDRRAGRISTEENKRICEILKENMGEIDGVKVSIYPGKEHRFVVVFKGEDLEEFLTDCDPQKEGKPIPEAKATAKSSERAARIVNSFLKRAIKVLSKEKKANAILMRGFSKIPPIPKMQDIFKLNPCAIATYPMYKGLAKLVGMEVLKTGDTLRDQIKTLKENYNKFDFFFFHYKKTDSKGEDGDFNGKVRAIEDFDQVLPEILSLNFSAVAITGDHSTPAKLKSHSWHPSPLAIHGEYVFPDDVNEFHERAFRKGSLGVIYSTDVLPILLALSGKLKKYGA